MLMVSGMVSIEDAGNKMSSRWNNHSNTSTRAFGLKGLVRIARE
jgi:hypothetical protein